MGVHLRWRESILPHAPPSSTFNARVSAPQTRGCQLEGMRLQARETICNRRYIHQKLRHNFYVGFKMIAFWTEVGLSVESELTARTVYISRICGGTYAPPTSVITLRPI